MNQNDFASEGLTTKVEQEHFMKTETLDEGNISFFDRSKDIKRKLTESGFEIPNLDDIFSKNEELESDDETA